MLKGQGSVPGERLELGLEKSSGLKVASSSFPLLPFPPSSPPPSPIPHMARPLITKPQFWFLLLKLFLLERKQTLTLAMPAASSPTHPSTHRSGTGRRELILSW